VIASSAGALDWWKTAIVADQGTEQPFSRKLRKACGVIFAIVGPLILCSSLNRRRPDSVKPLDLAKSRLEVVWQPFQDSVPLGPLVVGQSRSSYPPLDPPDAFSCDEPTADQRTAWSRVTEFPDRQSMAIATLPNGERESNATRAKPSGSFSLPRKTIRAPLPLVSTFSKSRDGRSLRAMVSVSASSRIVKQSTEDDRNS
jgi:hypothetical protein